MGREDFPDSDSDPASPEPGLQRKRGFSQIASSPPTQQSTRRTNTRRSKSNQSYEHTNKFCTQQCLLGLQKGGASLDGNCPNVNLHQQGQDNNQHQISADGLVQALKQQLDENIDHNCTPIGQCGSYGAPFKITSTAYGYTVIGKGTTTWLWKEVSHEADIYHVLRRVQGSAVPVFLGSIDLAKTYFLHGAGEIRHMLLMGWGGESTTKITIDKTIRREISRSRKEITTVPGSGASGSSVGEHPVECRIETGPNHQLSPVSIGWPADGKTDEGSQEIIIQGLGLTSRTQRRRRVV